jgi:hypothetical protein
MRQGDYVANVKPASLINWKELMKAAVDGRKKTAMSNEDQADILRYIMMRAEDKPPKKEPTIDDLIQQEVRKLR